VPADMHAHCMTVRCRSDAHMHARQQNLKVVVMIVAERDLAEIAATYLTKPRMHLANWMPQDAPLLLDSYHRMQCRIAAAADT
jgi:hypothetical protein